MKKIIFTAIMLLMVSCSEKEIVIDCGCVEVQEKLISTRSPYYPFAWDRSKSGDEYDALTRHLLDSNKEEYDTDGTLHLAKVAWRGLAGLQKHLEKMRNEK